MLQGISYEAIIYIKKCAIIYTEDTNAFIVKFNAESYIMWPLISSHVLIDPKCTSDLPPS